MLGGMGPLLTPDGLQNKATEKRFFYTADVSMHKNKVSLFARLVNFGCIMDMGCYVDIVQNAFSTILLKTVVLCVQGMGKTSAVMCRGARRCDRIYCSAMKESDLFLTADNTFVTVGDYHGVN